MSHKHVRCILNFQRNEFNVSAVCCGGTPHVQRGLPRGHLQHPLCCLLHQAEMPPYISQVKKNRSAVYHCPKERMLRKCFFMR